MGKYSIGIEFGLKAGSAVLVDVSNGAKLATISKDFTHGCIEEGSAIFQHPMDYLEVLQEVIPALLSYAEVPSTDIVGLGISFSHSSVLPVMNDGTPLCFFNEYSENTSALARLKSKKADRATVLSKIASERNEAFLSRFSAKACDPETITLAWDILESDPSVYETADLLMEASDWIIWQLTGVMTRSSCFAGFGSMWDNKTGYPDRDFFKALNPKLENLTDEKLAGDVTYVGDMAGCISPFVCEALGLSEDTVVAVGNASIQASLPALAIGEAGKLLINMDKTHEFLLLSNTLSYVPGICGSAYGSLAPEMYCYRAVQTGLCASLDWFIENLVPASLTQKADEEDICIKKLLSDEAKLKKAGEGGLIALDWFEGNKSVLSNDKLTGLFLGMTTQTTSVDMYRALLEAHAFGAKTIIDNFVASGIEVNEIYVTGKVAQKNEFFMQLLADVLNMPVKVKAVDNSAALGSAIIGAYVAGCYDDFSKASSKMGVALETIYLPVEAEANVYTKLYHEYTRLHDYFGRGANACMSRLNLIKASVAKDEELISTITAAITPDEEAVADLFDAINEVADNAVADEIITEEQDIPDIEIPTDAFDELLDSIDEDSADILVEDADALDYESTFEDVASSDSETDDSEADDSEADNSEADNSEADDSEADDSEAYDALVFAEMLEEQLQNDDIDFEALDDLAKLDGVAEDGDVVAEAFEDEATVNPEIEELMEKYGTVDASEPGVFEAEDIIDEIEELIKKYDAVADEAAEETLEEVEAGNEESATEEVMNEIAVTEDILDATTEAVAEEVITEVAMDDVAADASAEEAIADAYAEEAPAEEAIADAYAEEAPAEEAITDAYADAPASETLKITEAISVEDNTDTLDDTTPAENDITAPDDTTLEADIQDDEEMIPVPTLSSEFPEFSHSKVRTNTSIPDDFWRY